MQAQQHMFNPDNIMILMMTISEVVEVVWITTTH